MSTWYKLFFIILALTVLLGIQTSLSGAYAQYVGTTENNKGNELSQTYENKTANIIINYPANWFSETRNLEYPYMVRFFPKEFLAEHYPPVVLAVAFRNYSNSPNSLNLTQMADAFETPAQINPDARFINSTLNATLFNSTCTGISNKLL